MFTDFWLENLKENDHLLDPDVNERIILKWITDMGEGCGLN
jgi:hypothetical protein